MSEIEIEIDGKILKAQPNQSIIEVADAAGIYIPRFCYHKQLTVAANCRMCLVEVEKAPKTLPACATPVAPGMKVFTQSQKTIDAQRAVMEFLLINHPLDCPICDQGGECELQDLAMGYGSSISEYKECKRSVEDENLGPLIATEMTRCILCTRCVRFGAEIAGLRELGVTFRGEHEEISTFVEQAVTSEVSGNIIDLCPVGALTSKPFRFRARPWELDQWPSVGAHDCLGSNIHVHTRYGTVMRVVPRENMFINQMWLSDRDRFSYTGLYQDRVQEPLARINGKWKVVDWKKAFELITAQLQDVINAYGADKLGALASPNSTLEEFYLLQKIVRGLGSAHVDHRLREVDTQDHTYANGFPGLNMPVADLADQEVVLLIGSNIQKEQPLAVTHLRKASSKGASIFVVNPVDYQFNFKVNAKKIVGPQQMVSVLAQLLDAIQDNHEDSIAKGLQGKQKISILLGALAMHHTQASMIRYLVQQIAELTGAQIGFLTDGANGAGAWLSGCVSHANVGLNAYQMLEKPRHAYLLLNVEPEFDCANASLAIAALKQAQCVIAISTFKNKVLEECAHVILPASAFTESSGTFINTAAVPQSFKGVANPYGSSRPAWKILRVLGNFLHGDGFEYDSSDQVRDEVIALIEKMPPQAMNFSKPESKKQNENTLTRIGEIPIYAVDGLVRRAKPLQDIQPKMEGDVAMVRLHPETAGKLKLQNGDLANIKQQGYEVQLPVLIDERIAVDAAWVAGGIEATIGLGDLFGEVEVEKTN